MLQYSVPLPPLGKDSFRPNDPSSRLPPNSLNNKRLQKEAYSPRSAFAAPTPPIPLSISTNFTPPLQPSCSSSASSASFTLSPRSPYISSSNQPAASSPVSLPLSPKLLDSAYLSSPRPSSDFSSPVADVMAPGDFVGEGGCLQGEIIRLVSSSSATLDGEDPAIEFEVVRRLGNGSYAVVYLVREVLYRPPPSEDGHSSVMGSMELDDKLSRPSIEYGREYAVKCLSKANLDEDALTAQMSEVTIHQSLRSHPNIVTLHRTLETASFLLLLLEFVPGEDLFYFLEQARDHYELDSPASTELPTSSSCTPPTPSLLSNLHPDQLLSPIRLRLIASMFSQMCEAVAACHAQQIFHRDIKPENFIVTDGWATLADGRRERKVVVKLTDFGLSITDPESADMDCGSAPYMSYECKNNVAPTYRPRGADVWSLGIVLINMLYHYNPWTDTTTNADWSPCSSFGFFRQQPVNFFMQRFDGMTRPVADLLANKVFCILEDQTDDSQRITASEFGAWAKDLPALLGDHSRSGHKRPPSASPTTCHPISSSLLQSHRPSSRQPSGAPALRTPALPSRSLSSTTSLGPAYELEISELSTVYDQLEEQYEQDGDVEVEGMISRSTSTNKRRKRGARKGKGTTVVGPALTQNETLETLAVASQSLAREISKASRSSGKTSGSRSSRRNQPFEPVAIFPLPVYLLSSAVSASPARSPPLASTAHTRVPVVVKKPSKWKLSFGKSSGGRVSPVEEASQSMETGTAPMASNVSSLIMGLDAASSQPGGSHMSGDSTWSRGRRLRQPQNFSDSRSVGGRSNTSYSPQASLERSMNDDRRAVSPGSIRSGRPLASSASSMVSGNWRNSMSSSAATSTSAFTRYSNSSMRSVSTTATSVSASSWRTHGNASSPVKSKPAPPAVPGLPKNIKYMTGTPWELGQLPRGWHANITREIPIRNHRARKPKELPLDTINERPGNATSKPPVMQRRDASTSTTDLAGIIRDNGGKEETDSPKKVQRGQITALAKMLSALRR